MSPRPVSIAIKPALRPFLYMSKDEAERAISDPRLMAGYRAVRRWAACNFSGCDGEVQEAFWVKFGQDAFYARINKVRRACGFTAFRKL